MTLLWEHITMIQQHLDIMPISQFDIMPTAQLDIMPTSQFDIMPTSQFDIVPTSQFDIMPTSKRCTNQFIPDGRNNVSAQRQRRNRHLLQLGKHLNHMFEYS
jgi:hypothetical protein